MMIHSDQLRAMELPPRRRFEAEMTEHLYDFAPSQCEALGEPLVRGMIQQGLADAAGYGFSNRGPVRLYLELMFLFGSRFDTDPLLSWASRSLREPGTDQMVRVERLHAATLAYLEHTAGPGFCHETEALQRARSMRYEESSGPSTSFEAACMERLTTLYPQRAVYAGEAAIGTMMLEAIRAAHGYSITSQQGMLLFSTLMFVLGHGFAEDRLFPWAGRVLNEETVDTPEMRARQLFGAAVTYFDQVISNLD